MWIIVAFDLPVKKYTDRKNYRDFRKKLLQHGFFAVQESIFMRHLNSTSHTNVVYSYLQNQIPKSGSVIFFKIPDISFQQAVFFTDNKKITLPVNKEKWIIF